MISELATHIRAALVAAGLSADRVVLGAAGLATMKLLPRAVVHWARTEELLRRDGTLVAWTTQNGNRVYHRRIYRRDLDTMVQVDAATHEQAEDILTAMVAAMGKGLVDSHGWWIQFGDILIGRVEDKAQMTQQASAAAKIECIGGIYTSRPAAMAQDVSPTGQLVQEV